MLYLILVIILYDKTNLIKVQLSSFPELVRFQSFIILTFDPGVTMSFNGDHSPNFFRQTSLLFHKWLAERFNLDDA